MANLGKPFSVRLQEGHAEEIKQLSGRPASEILRKLGEAWLIRARSDRASQPVEQVDTEIEATAKEQQK